MTTGLFATEGRKKMAIFSRPIWALADGLLVRKGNPKVTHGLSRHCRQQRCSVGVIRGQVQHDAVVQFGVPGVAVRIFETYMRRPSRGKRDRRRLRQRRPRSCCLCEQHPELTLKSLALVR